MPEYTYTDEHDHISIAFHGMHENPEIICGCGLPMWRKPTVKGINWGGLSPSQGEMHPNTIEFLNGVDERRERFEEEHKAHEERTKDEYTS
jgi:hypothetical protein